MYGKEKKTESRSIRMTKTVYDYVDGFEGTGFNEKFENLVLKMMVVEPDLDLRIENKRESIYSLDKEFTIKSRHFLDKLRLLDYEVSKMLNAFTDL